MEIEGGSKGPPDFLEGRMDMVVATVMSFVVLGDIANRRDPDVRISLIIWGIYFLFGLWILGVI